jgi:hypothetical protein
MDSGSLGDREAIKVAARGHIETSDRRAPRRKNAAFGTMRSIVAGSGLPLKEWRK